MNLKDFIAELKALQKEEENPLIVNSSGEDVLSIDFDVDLNCIVIYFNLDLLVVKNDDSNIPVFGLDDVDINPK